ncbi:RsmE family RNA methyltransferase [Tessaracoccus coleopterorum]|uniref:RsmE family RNA methyltransferase n=1 Tax=Tessaracoccus coleopterorum TaxID=2714950 RepID=UPI0038CD4AD0
MQALAKGDRSDIAVQTATELGARRILAWQASRSIVRWQGERGAKALEKWRSTGREAAKQARRFRVPRSTSPPPTTSCGPSAGHRSRSCSTRPRMATSPRPNCPTTGRAC